jgi:HEPN domain-containing protein
MSYEEAEILRSRAYSFLRNAKALFNEGEYDLAAFNVEQFCQLLLKYKLLMKTGSYPRTHSIVRLAEYLSKAAGGKLDKFIESEIMFLTKLEDAYIGARYLPRKYERGEVEKLLLFSEKFREEIENV